MREKPQHTEVCEDFSLEHNATIRLYLLQLIRADIKDEEQGLRSPKKRSLPCVNEHFEGKRNAAIRLYIRL